MAIDRNEGQGTAAAAQAQPRIKWDESNKPLTDWPDTAQIAPGVFTNPASQWVRSLDVTAPLNAKCYASASSMLATVTGQESSVASSTIEHTRHLECRRGLKAAS